MIRSSILYFLRSNSVLKVSARLFKHQKLAHGTKHFKFSKQAVQSSNALCITNRQILQPSLSNGNVFSRCVNLSSILCVKQHADSENTFAHSVLERAESPYSNCIAPVSPKLEECVPKLSDEDFKLLLSSNWEAYTSTELVESFQLISHHVLNQHQDIDISNACFDSMCQELVKKCKEFNFDQFCKVLHYLSFWPPTETSKSHNFKELWNALDSACTDHIKEWNFTQLFLLSDHWYRLNLAGINYFNWQSINRWARKASRLTPQQLVQSLFYINLRRTFPAGVDFIDYQVCLERCADQLSVEELGVCAMAFFKTQQKVRAPRLLEIMIRKTLAEVETVHSITLAAILKVLRSSLPVELVEGVQLLLDRLVPRVPHLPLVCGLHIALAGSNVQLLHEEIIQAVLKQFLAQISTVRIKDLERMAFMLSLYNWPAELPGGGDVYELLAAEVGRPERKWEVDQHPRCLTNLLQYLSIAGLYPREHINKVLSANFINTYSLAMKKVGSEMLSLDVAVEIECPDYSGNRLDKRTRRFLARTVSQHPQKWQDGDANKGSAGDRMLKGVMAATLSLVKDPHMLFTGHILPNHFRADLVVRISEDQPLRFLPIPSSLQEVELGEVRRPQGGGRWLCLVLGGWNLLMRGSGEPVGGLAQKLRMLARIGYTPILIPWSEWQTAPQKSDYILGKINSVGKRDILQVDRRTGT